MKHFRLFQIEPEHIGLTVEEYLKQILNYSGRKIQKLTRIKGIQLANKPVFLQKKLKNGDKLRIQILEDFAYGVQPENGPIEILYEDSHCIVVNKPPQQLVHPTGATTNGTTANYLANYFQQQGVVRCIRPLHRLDRDTSGCVIFAKNAESQKELEKQLNANILKRIYCALVKGVIVPDAGTISAPIAIHPSLPNRRIISEKGNEAVTHYRTIKSFSEYSLLELTLETGRTHQIRVHLSHIECPILGDGMYGVRSHWINRQALHASSVTFRSINTNQPITVSAPLSSDFSYALEGLGIIANP